MKTIFTNAELAHVWMAQKQNYGQNASRSMFFIGSTIYSYSEHFPLAKIFKKEKIILVNDGKTTMTTTTKHYPAISRALDRNNYKIVYAPYATGTCTKLMGMTLESTAEYFYQNIYEKMGEVLAGNATYDEVQAAVLEYQNFCKHAKLKIKKVEMPEHFIALLKEISAITWAAIERKIERKKELAATKEARAIAKAEKNIEAWKRGENVSISKLPRIYLRKTFGVSYNTPRGELWLYVQTSKGATVPYQEALDLWNEMKCYPEGNFVGRQLGFYTVNAVSRDKIVIGCHVLERKILDEFFNNLGE